MKYVISDECEIGDLSEPKYAQSYADELDQALSPERFLELLMMEIEAYCEAYEGDPNEIKAQFQQNMSELINGEPVHINGMVFKIIKD